MRKHAGELFPFSFPFMKLLLMSLFQPHSQAYGQYSQREARIKRHPEIRERADLQAHGCYQDKHVDITHQYGVQTAWLPSGAVGWGGKPHFLRVTKPRSGDT